MIIQSDETARLHRTFALTHDRVILVRIGYEYVKIL